ncbi:MAG TPA: ABC transporter permease subunit [Gaiellaceae bacterium]|nr:ABC transporter permease subunit [Gaiellaceae bacterium]
MSPARALALRTLADARVRTGSFGALFFGIGYAVTAGYVKTNPTLADRIQFARAFANNMVFRLFYGTPHNLDTVGGYASWRGGGVLALFAAYFGAAAAVRALRGEEESGRFEVVAAGAITRRSAVAARLAAVGATVAALWLAALLGFAAGGLGGSGSAYLALAVVTAAAVYAAIGALTSQLAPSRRTALELAGLVIGVDLVIRIVADTTGTLWLHWLTPLGWIEELRPFADPRPAVLVLPAALIAVLLSAATRIERRRDVGSAVFAAHDSRERPRVRLLSSPSALLVRFEWISLAVWATAIAGYGIVVGTVSKSAASGLSASLKEQIAKLGESRILTPSGFIGLTFLFFILAISLYCCGQLAAARNEEAESRLETLFALAQDRTRWLGGRLLVAAGGATLLALVAGAGAAAGAKIVGAQVSFVRLLEAGLNCLPACLLFLGLATLLVAAAPRHGVGAAYGLVCVAFVWDLFGALLRAPSWLLGMTPFDHVGLIPAQHFRPGAAAVMVIVAMLAAGAGGAVFRRRDLASA